MPTYLLHGFRWRRESIRIHIVMNDLGDAAAEWILAPATSLSLLNSFYANFDFLPPSNPPQQKYDIPVPPIPTEGDFKPRTLKKGHKASISSLRSLGRKNRPPNLVSSRKENGTREIGSARNAQQSSTSTSLSSLPVPKDPALVNFNQWSVVKLMEQYDPNDTTTVSQPFAYVADYMVEITLAANLKEEAAKYEEKVREADWPLSSPATPGSPEKGEEKGHTANSSMDLGAMSPRDIRRKSRRLGWLEKLRDGLQQGEDIGWFVVYCGDEERAVPEIQRVSSWESGEEESPQRTPRSASFRAFFRGRNNTIGE